MQMQKTAKKKLKPKKNGQFSGGGLSSNFRLRQVLPQTRVSERWEKHRKFEKNIIFNMALERSNTSIIFWFQRGSALLQKIFFFLVVRCDLGLDTVLDSFVNIFQYHLPVLFPAIRMCHRVRICFPSAFVQKICFC